MPVVHPNRMHELKKEMEDKLPKHSEITDSNVVILHSVFSAAVADEIDLPTILVLHGGLREAGHFHNVMSGAANPTSKYFTDKTITEIREIVSNWLDKPDVLAANSKFTQSSVKEYYDADSTVIYPPIDTKQFTLGESEYTEDYYLSVQRLVWYKRPEVQIEAFSELDETLYIVGEGTFSDAVKGEAQKYDNIHYLGRVSDEELLELYRGAKATIQTSMKEDYGYIPREGLACGTPAITPYEGGYMELHDKDDVGEYFDPNNRISGLQEAVTRFNPEKYNSNELRELVVEECSFDKTEQKFKEAITNAKRRAEN